MVMGQDSGQNDGMGTKLAVALLTLGVSLAGAEKTNDQSKKPEKHATVARRVVVERAPLQTQGALVQGAGASEADRHEAAVELFLARERQKTREREAAARALNPLSN